MAVEFFRIKVPKEEVLELLTLTERAECLINIGYGTTVASGKSIEGLLSLDNYRDWLFVMHDISSPKDYEIGEIIKEKWGYKNKDADIENNEEQT